MDTKPKVFVASSAEAIRLAEAVQANLRKNAEVKLWTQNAFGLGRNFIDELIRNVRKSNFGVCIFSPDDTLIIRGKRQKSTRDNVIFELGLLMGRLGKQRSFIVKPEKSADAIRELSDLLGIVPAEYDGNQAKTDPEGALGDVCTQIKDAMTRELKSQSRRLAGRVNRLIGNALETVCRAMSVPVSPAEVSLRVFIFQKTHENGHEKLVCRYCWAPNPTTEHVGDYFDIDKRTASRIVVAKCYLENRTRKTDDLKRSKVKPLPREFEGAKGRGEIKKDLQYVLAAPIRNKDKSIWGVVDFDSSDPKGTILLQTKVAESVMFRLAEHLSWLLT